MKNRIRTLSAEVLTAVLAVLLLIGGALGFVSTKPVRAGAESATPILLTSEEDYRTYAAALNGGSETVEIGGTSYTIAGSQVMLSGNIVLTGDPVSLGTAEHPFKGTFNGANYTVTVPDGTGYIFGTVADATVGGIKVSGTAGLIGTVAGDVTILNGTISVSGTLIGTVAAGATVTINDNAAVISASAFAETNNGTIVIRNFSSITVSGGISSDYFAVEAPNGVDYTVSESGVHTYLQVSGVAKIGTTYYTTVQAAIEAASGETTVILVNDVSEDIAVEAGQNIVLDLNGHTLANAGGHTITNSGTLTVTGEGTVDNVTHGKAAVYNNVNATAVLNGGTFTRSREAGTTSGNGGNSYYVILNQGTLTVNAGVTVEANGGYSSLIENGWYNAAQNTTSATAVLTINGGTFSGGVNTVKNDEYGVATITNGTFTNTTQAVLLNWNELTVEGGEFIGSDTVAAVVTGYYSDETSVGKTTLKAGEYTGSLSEFSGYSSGIDYEITGGTYSEIPNYSYFADGYVHEALSDGTYGVAGGTGEEARSYVAIIGTVGYETLASAISAAAGKTVLLLDDLSLDSQITITKNNVTLDLGGHTISSTADVLFLIRNMNVTVKNGTINATGEVFELVGGSGLASKTLTLAEDLNVVSETDSCVFIYGSIKLVTSANLTSKGEYATIQGNGANTGYTYITINGGNIVSENSTAIYQPQYNGTLTVNGGTITGTTGIEIRGGKLTVNGGTITATAAVFSEEANGSGSTITGAAVAVSQHTTNKPTKLTVNGGTLTGIYAVYEKDLQDEDTTGISLSLTGGTYEGDVASENKTQFITGGTYSETLNADYISSSALVNAQEDGTYRVYTDAEAVSTLGYVVKIGVTGYETLAHAVAAVPADNAETTIVFLPAESVVSGAGVKVKAGQNIVIDFNGITYNVTNTVGSAGTETNGFQLLKGSTVTMKNGTLTSSTAYILIQNYCNLTLVDMTLDESANSDIDYVVSNNFGSLTVAGDTDIIAAEGKVAFDLYYGMSSSYDDGITVTFGDDFTGTVKGTIEYGKDNRVTSDTWQEKAALTIENGTFDVTFSVSGDADDANVTISGGTYSELPNYNYLATGFVHTQTTDSEGNTVYGVTTGSYVASIGAVGYVAFTDAFAAAESGDTIVLQANVALDAGLTVTKNITIDLNGKTITSAETAFVVDGATLTVKDSATNGTIKVTNDYGIFVKNGGTAVIESGAVESKYAAFSSNNTTGAGNFTVNGGKIAAEQGPAIYMPAMGTLTVSGGTVQGGIIARMGNIEISGGTIIAPTTNLDKIEEYYSYGGNAWFGGALTLLTGTYTFEGGNSLTANVTGGTFVNEYADTEKQFANAITVYVTGKTAQTVNVSVAESGVSYTVPAIGQNVVFTDVASVVGETYNPSYAANVNVPEYNGAELPVIAGTTYYATLTEAIAAAQSGETVKLLADITDESEVIYVTRTMTIDLNGKTLSFTNGETKGLRIEQDSIEVTIKNGTITSNNRAIMLKKGKLSLVSVYAVNVGTELQTIDVQNDAELTVDVNSVIENAHDGFAIVPYYSAVVNVYGTVKASGEAAISTNGSYSHDVTINVYSGAVIINNAGCGVYLPTGTLNVYGGTITGTTGIEIRAGELNVQGGEITATATAFSATANGNGSTIEGAAIAVSQHTTNLPISVTLNGGTLTGIYAVYEEDLQDGVAQSVTLSLTEGSYVGEVESKNVTGFISGGTYTTRPKYEYCADAYYAHYDEATNTYSIAAGYFAALLNGYGYETLQAAIEAAQSGDTIVILDGITLEEGLTVNKNLTIDLNGKTITSAETAFVVDGATLTVKDGATNGTIKVTNDYGIFVKNDGTVVIESGTVESLYAALSSNNTTGKGNFTVNGGKIAAEQGPAIYMPAMGTLTVSDGTVQGGIIARMGTIEISGGTIIAPTTNLDKIEEYYSYGGNAWFGGALTLLTGTYTFEGGNSLTANVTGGTFVNEYAGTEAQFANAITVYVTGKTAQTVNVSVAESGVNYTVPAIGQNVVFTDVANVVGDAYNPSYAANVNVPAYNGYYLPVISGATYYKTVVEAVTAAQSGDTIKLLKDVNGKIHTDKDLTVDLNGHTLNATSNIAVYIKSGANNVTVKNGTIKSVYTGASYSIVGVYNTAAANVLLDNVTIDLSSTESTVASSGRYPSSYAVYSTVGTLTIKNSNIKVTCDVGQDEEGNKNAWYGYAVLVDSVDTLEISGTTIESNGYGIGIFGKYETSEIRTALANNEVLDNVTVTVTDSVIRTEVFCVANNGSYHGTVISITDSTLESELSAAIYHPGYGDLTIGGNTTLIGTTGIEMRAGNLTINDDTVTVTATASPAEVEANGGGSSMLGIAVAISQHTTNLPVSASLNGGTYNGVYSVYEEDLQDGVTEGVTISLTDGTYEGEVASENVEKFVSGGTYSTLPKYEYLTDTVYAQYDSETGIYTVTEGTFAAKTGDYGYETLQAAINAAADGATVTLLSNVAEDITVAAEKNITLDLNGYILTSSGSRKATLTNNGTLKVIDGSAEKSGKITRVSTARSVDWYYVIVNEGNLTLDGITVENTTNDYSSLIINNKDCRAENAATLTIKSGTYVSGGSNAVKNDEYGVLVIEGGTFKTTEANGNYAAVMTWGVATVSGGEFVGENGSVALTVAAYGGETNTTTVTGGTFTSESAAVYVKNGDSGNDGGAIELDLVGGVYEGKIQLLDTEEFPSEGVAIEISGGEYAVAPHWSFFNDAYSLGNLNEETGCYAVVNVAYVAVVTETDTAYTTLAAAVAAAETLEGTPVIALLRDNAETVALNDAVLDLAGYAITGTVTLNSGNAEVIAPAGDISYFNAVIKGANGYLVAYYNTAENRVYTLADIYFSSPELFLNGHAAVITAQDSANPETDTNLFVSYTVDGIDYVALYNSATAARVFGGWKSPDYGDSHRDTTNVNISITLNSGKVDSLRGSSKDKKDANSIYLDCKMNTATIVVNGGSVGIVAAGWYYNQSMEEFNVIVNGGTVGTVYGNGETSYTASYEMPAGYVPTVKLANITIRGGTVGYVYGGGRAVTQKATSASYSMVTEKAVINVTGGTVGYVNGGGFNGPEANWGETTGQDTVIVKEAVITVSGGNVTNVFGGGYNGQWKFTHKINADGELVFSNYNGTDETQTVRNIVENSTVNVENGANITNLYLGGRSYAYVENVTANVTGGNIGTMSMSGNYGHVESSNATVSGGVIDKLELVTRNYVENINLSVLSGAQVNAFYAGVGGAYKNSNCVEKEYNLSTAAVLGNVNVSAAEGTVANGYLTTGLERAQEVTVTGISLALTEINLVADSGYTGTLTKSGDFVAATDSIWNAVIVVNNASTGNDAVLTGVDANGKTVRFTPPAGSYLKADSSVENGYVLADIVATVTNAEGVISFFDSLGKAIAAAADGATVTLVSDLTDNSTKFDIGSSITIDLNGKTLSLPNTYYGFYLNNSAVELTVKNGTVTGTDSLATVYAGKLNLVDAEFVNSGSSYFAIQMTGSSELTVDADSVVRNTSNGPAITLWDTSTARIYGTVAADTHFAIATNGNAGQQATLYVYDGAEISSNATAIYLPSGTAYIEGGAITGETGIEVRAGSLTVNGGRITATATEFAKEANGNGSTVIGAAIAVSQHTTNLPVSVTLNGGTLSGIYAVYEEDLQDEVTDGVTLSLTGGTFTGKVASENVEEFITGGIYSEIPNYAYFAENKVHDDLGNGTYGVKTGDYVATIGTVGYETLAAAVAAAQSGDTVTLLDDLSLDSQITIDKNLTLDLGGHTVSSTAYTAFRVNNVNVTVENGSINATYEAFRAVGGEGEAVNTLTLNDDLNVVSETDCSVFIYGSIKLVTSANLTSKGVYATIQGNGSNAGYTDITINGGSVISEISTAIYQPQYNGKLTVNGGEIKGKTGIEIRGGELIINDGTVIATATTFEEEANGSGSTITGAAVAVSQHTTNKPTKLTVNGGTLTGIYAVYEKDLQDEDTTGISLSLTGGTYEGEVASENVEEFISGGIYSAIPNYTYLAEGYVHEALADGTYGVKTGAYVAAIGTMGYETLQAAINAAADGATVTLLSNVAEDITVAAEKNITLDLNGYILTSSGSRKATLTNNGTLKVIDGSAEKSGKITRVSMARSVVWYYVIVNEGNLTLDGITVENTTNDYSSLIINNKDCRAENAATLTIKSGTYVSGGSNAVKNDEYGVLVIEGGTFKTTEANGNYAAVMTWGVATISGGEFVGENGNVALTVAAYGGETNTTTVTGGTFTSESAAVYVKNGDSGNDGGTINLDLVGGVYEGKIQLLDTEEFPSEGVAIEISGGTFTAAGELLNSYTITAETAVYYTTDPAVTTVSALASVPANAVLVGGRSRSGFAGYTIDPAYIAFNIGSETIIITAEDFAQRALEEIVSYKDSLLASYLYSENGTAQLESVVENASAVMEGFAAADSFDDIMKAYNTAIRDLDAVLTVNEEAASLADAVADAKADVRLYAAVLGVALPEDIYTEIENAVNVSQVKAAKLAAMDRLDQILADAVAALEAAKEAAIAEIQAASAETAEGAGDAVVVPTATYAAINNAASLDEVAFYKTNALAEINDVRVYRAELNALIGGDGETVLEAIQAISDALFDTVDGNGETVYGKLSQLQSALETKIGDAQNAINEATSTELETLYDDLTDYLDSALAELQSVLTSAIDGLSTQIAGVSTAVDAIHEVLGISVDAETQAYVSSAIEAIKDALDGIEGDLETDYNEIITEIGEAQTAITTAISGLQSTLTTAIEGLSAKIDTIDANVDAIYEVLGISYDAETQKNVSSAIKAINEALDGIEGDLATDYNAIIAKIGEAITAIGTAETNIKNAITAATNTLTGRLDTVDTALTAIKGVVDSNNGKLDQLATDLAAAKAAVDTANAKLVALDGRITNEVLTAIAAAKAAAEQVTTDLTNVINTAIGTVNATIATLTEQISQYNTQLATVGNNVSQLLVGLGEAKSEILNALSGLNGAITDPDGAMAENTQEILDKIAQAQEKIDSIGETVGAIVIVEESKEEAKQELQTWINAYVDNILNPAAGGDTAERGVQTFAAVVTGRTVKAFADVPADLESKIREAFSAKNAELVIKYYKEAIDAINAATTTEEISIAVSTFKTQVATVEVIDSLKPADNTGLYVLLVIIAVAVIAAVVILILLLLKKNAPAPVAEEVSEKETAEPEQAPAEEVSEEVVAEPEQAPAEPEEEPAEEVSEEEDDEDDLSEEEDGADAETAIALPGEDVSELIKRYNFSYAARLVLADPILQVASGTLTDEILAYKGVKVRESWKQKRFNKGRKTVAALLFKGKKLCLALALDPAKYADTKYRVTDVSQVKRFAQTPTLIKLTSARKMKYAKELIARMMEEIGAPRMEGMGPDEDATKYLLRRETPEKLVSRGLARTYEVDASATEFFNKSKD